MNIDSEIWRVDCIHIYIILRSTIQDKKPYQYNMMGSTFTADSRYLDFDYLE